MEKFYVTFGQLSPNKNGVYEVFAHGELELRLFANRNLDGDFANWCSVYTPEQWANPEYNKYYPQGILKTITIPGTEHKDQKLKNHLENYAENIIDSKVYQITNIRKSIEYRKEQDDDRIISYFFSSMFLSSLLDEFSNDFLTAKNQEEQLKIIKKFLFYAFDTGILFERLRNSEHESKFRENS